MRPKGGNLPRRPCLAGPASTSAGLSARFSPTDWVSRDTQSVGEKRADSPALVLAGPARHGLLGRFPPFGRIHLADRLLHFLRCGTSLPIISFDSLPRATLETFTDRDDGSGFSGLTGPAGPASWASLNGASRCGT